MNGSKFRKKKSTPLLGKYELGALLGRGTFAKVYLAHAVADGAPVAVKVIDKEAAAAAMAGGTAAVAAVLREVSAMRRLRHHPGVLRLHEVLASRARIYLVMELATGGDLLSWLAATLPRRCGGRLPEHAVRRVFVQLVAALAHCHARGVAHRDVKPQNILLDGDGNVKLADFGFAALDVVPDSGGLLQTACGTPAYAAPEVILRRRGGYDGAKADAWSCGVVLFVLLAGRLPFDDANVPDMCRKARRREYRELPPWVSPPARRLVHRLLDPNPATRVAVEVLVATHPWFKPRSLSLDNSQLGGGCGQPEPECAPASKLNAFDIISMSPGLDLSGLFRGSSRSSRERRFTTTASPERTMEQLCSASGKLRYAVMVVGKKEVDPCLNPLSKAGMAMSVEMSELAPPLMLVEMRLEMDDGEREDGEGFGWEELRLELGDVVRSWHSSDSEDLLHQTD